MMSIDKTRATHPKHGDADDLDDVGGHSLKIGFDDAGDVDDVSGHSFRDAFTDDGVEQGSLDEDDVNGHSVSPAPPSINGALSVDPKAR